MTKQKKNIRVAIYLRCSTVDQSVEMQRRDLLRYADQRNFEVAKEYVDEGISGTKDSRPALNELMNAARKRLFDAVIVWRFDRFARSTRHLLQSLAEFRSLGIDFISYQENIDTSSPLGEALFTIVAAIGQLERDIIVSRVKAGLQNAKANGKKLGRPKKRDDARIQSLRRQGESIRSIARRLGVSTTAVQRGLGVTKSSFFDIAKPQ